MIRTKTPLSCEILFEHPKFVIRAYAKTIAKVNHPKIEWNDRNVLMGQITAGWFLCEKLHQNDIQSKKKLQKNSQSYLCALVKWIHANAFSF